MSAGTRSFQFGRIAWALRKGLGLFVVYVALASFYQAVRGDSVLGALLYLLLGVVGLYLVANWK